MERSTLIKIVIAILAALILVRFVLRRRRAHAARRFREHYDAYDEQTGPEVWETTPPGTTSAPVATSGPLTFSTPTPGPTTISASLLPKPDGSADDPSSWSQFAPQTLTGQQLIDPRKFIGVDTVGSTLKNASHDLRRDPPIPKQEVSPWINSSVDPDPYKRSLDGC